MKTSAAAGEHQRWNKREENERTSVLIYSAGELVDGRRDLETLVQHPALTLKTDILGPLDKAGKVLLGLDVVSNAEVLRSLLEQRVLLLLGRLLGRSRRSRTLGSLSHFVSAATSTRCDSVQV